MKTPTKADTENPIYGPLPFEEVMARLESGYGFTDEEIERIKWEFPAVYEEQTDDAECSEAEVEDWTDWTGEIPEDE